MHFGNFCGTEIRSEDGELEVEKLLNISKSMLYAPSENEFETILKNASSNSLVKQHLKPPRMPSQTTSSRVGLVLQVETEGFIDKYKIFMKKACNEGVATGKGIRCSAIHRFCNNLTGCILQVLPDLCGKRSVRCRLNISIRFCFLGSVCQLQEDAYEVVSKRTQDVKCTVDMTIGCCTCLGGNTGGSCRLIAEAAVENVF